MDEKEYRECMANMDVIEVLIHKKKAEEFLAQGNTEDALAYCMASGFRMGWEAHKKKLASQ